MMRAAIVVVAAAFVLLYAGTAVLWLRSYHVSDLLECQEPGEIPFTIHQLWAERGVLCFNKDTRGMRDGDEDGSFMAAPTDRIWKLKHLAVRDNSWRLRGSLWNRLGFAHIIADAHGEAWTIPVWTVTGLIALPPATLLFAKMPGRKARRRGGCRSFTVRLGRQRK